MNKPYLKSLVWLRRDLRLHDNTALYEAASQSKSISICFVFDTNILGKLKNKNDQRVDFIYQVLQFQISNIFRPKKQKKKYGII